MRLAGIKSYTEVNKFLTEKFLPWHNAKYTHQTESSYMPLPQDKNLDLIFCIKKERMVNNDNTVQIYGQTIQIPPSNVRLSFAKAKVDVCLLEDNRIYVLYKGKVIAESKLSSHNKVIKKDKEIEKFLNVRKYTTILSRLSHCFKRRTVYRPPKDHIWRRIEHAKILKEATHRRLTFQNSKKLTY